MPSSPAPEPGGLLNLLKPPGMTAHDVVAFARRRLGTKKVGHAGTLDPLAVGVLPVAVGMATRLLPFLRSGKEYVAEVQFGLSTSTADAEGEVLESRDCAFDEAALRAVMPRFMGAIAQRPPMVSAVHHQGKRLYELARAGIVIEDLPTRQVTIEELELLAFYPGPRPRARIRVACTAGTYIRSLAVDLGLALGTPASLAFLLRTRAGDFPLESALTLTEAWSYTPDDVALAPLVRRDVTADEARAIGNGKMLERREVPPSSLVRAYHHDRLLAVYEAQGDRLVPRMVTAAAALAAQGSGSAGAPPA